MIPSVYINLEDDVAKVAARIKKEKANELVLVCPKRCQLFADSINLRLLKKQADLLKKEVHILTMDERGQLYAKEAGFGLKFLPKGRPQTGVSDIQFHKLQPPPIEEAAEGAGLIQTVKSVTSFVSGLVSKKPDPDAAPVAIGQTVFEDPELSRDIFDSEKSTTGKRHTKKPSVKVSLGSIEAGQTAGSRGKQKGKRTYAVLLTASLALSLVIALGLLFVVLPGATVAVFPKTEPVTRDFDVSLDPQAKSPDSAKSFLPAEKIDEIVDLKSKFKSQGKKDVGNKASGSVIIYNFTGQVLNLKAETTSFSAGSKTYYLLEDAMQIKPTKYKNAQTKEIDESSLSQGFAVVAAAGGEDSNLPAGVRVEISNQVFGSRPQILYAKTETPVSGGTSRFLSLVSDGDIAAAQTELASLALKQIGDKLAQRGLQIIENSYRMEQLEFSSDKQVGTESPGFEASAKIKIIGLAFSAESLKSLVIERISKTLSDTNYLKTESDFNLSYKIRTADLNIPVAVLAVHFEGKLAANLDLAELPGKLLGKSIQEANEILQSMAPIEKVEITLSPSWQTNFPWFARKIKVELIE